MDSAAQSLELTKASLESATRSREALLEVRSVRKSYQIGNRSVEVLQGLNLSVQRGAFMALQGASGAGKSTLLHLIGGLDTPSSGDILFSGQNLARFSEKELARFRNRRIGFVFQACHLFPELDALENVCLPARMSRREPARTEETARELLQRVGLGSRMDHKPSELSGGEQQRVVVARALINTPELILADEPTGNLDSRTGREIIELLCRLREEHQTTLLIATHDPTIATRAPHVIELVDGRIK